MNFEKNIETEDIVDSTIEKVADENYEIINELKEREEEGSQRETIKKAFVSNFKFKIEDELMAIEGIDKKNSLKEIILEFRKKYPLKEIEEKLYQKAEEFIKRW